MNSNLMHQCPCERVWWRCPPHRQVHFFHRRISSVRASNIPHILVALSTVDHSSACRTTATFICSTWSLQVHV